MISADLERFRGTKVAVGLSGGVDSSLVLALLVEAGALATGITMKIWKPGVGPEQASPGDACYGPGEVDDVAACERLCSSLGVPYLAMDLSAEYEERVLGYFRAEYKRGRTPNPCVRCNQDMKFGFLLERARDAGVGFEVFATGHYARIAPRSGVPTLRRAADQAKDQSYFLYRLDSAILSRTAFPLGGMSKAEVRAEARRLGLEAADKPESQDFVAGGYASLFGDDEPGDIVDESGAVLGRHRGIVHYTIGQRRGLAISSRPGCAGASPEPLYVSAIDAERNRVIVSGDDSLLAGSIDGGDAILRDRRLAGSPFRATVRIRHNHRPAPALVTVTGDRAHVVFDDAQRAVAPGQSAVFYDDEGFVLGGCVIEAGGRVMASRLA